MQDATPLDRKRNRISGAEAHDILPKMLRIAHGLAVDGGDHIPNPKIGKSGRFPLSRPATITPD